jgi:hypothetical protein
MPRPRCYRCLLPLLFVITGTLHADVVELFDGRRIETPVLMFDGDKLVLADGQTFDRNEVRRVLFGADLSTFVAEEERAAAGDVAELLAVAERGRTAYPDAGAITLTESATWTLTPDGRHLERIHSAKLILKEPWKSLGNISQWFTEGRDRVRLIEARTILPDGSVHPFEPDDLREAKPTGGMAFFSEYKSLSGQLPRVEVGSIIETTWERETYNPYDRLLFFPRWYFGSTEPVLHSRATVRVPHDQPLHWQTRNLAGDLAAPDRVEEDEYAVYTWELTDIPPVVREPAMPPVGQVVPSVACSLLENWDYIFDFLGTFQREHMTVTPEIAQQVAEIVGDEQDPEQQLARIYHWLQREIRYVSIKGSMGSGWSGHPAALTLRNKYGDCIDKAVLFSTMLKTLDIDSSPVIVATNSMPADDRTLPTLYGNHAFNKITLGDRSFHLDSTATTYRYPFFRMDDHGITTINVREREIGMTEVPPADDNAVGARLRMRLSEDGTLKAILDLNFNGSMEAMARRWLEQVNTLLRRQVLQQGLNQFCPGAQLKELEITDEADLAQPLQATLKIVLPEYPTFAGDLMIFEMPLARLTRLFAVISALDERDFDVQMPTTMCVRQRTELELPSGYQVRGLPDGVALNSAYASYNANYRLGDQKVVFEDELKLTRRVVPRDDYDRLKTFMEDVTDYVKLPLFLFKERR